MHTDVVGLTQQLVRIPSLNPMGRKVTGPEYLESRVSDYLQHHFESLGWAWERHPVMPGRDNIVARWDPPAGDEHGLILMEVHQDTVPVDGMTIDPFAADLRDGRIYGRGACDVKGGMAAILAATHQATLAPTRHQPSIVVACTVNEENGFDGVKHLCTLWKNGQSRLLSRRPDWAVVAEPTELDVVVAHKGTVRWRVHTLGRAAHSSNPSAGCNAIYHMARVLATLERYASTELPPTQHELLSGPSLSVGTIAGGVSVNTVPDRCSIEIDRRLLPHESAEEAVAHVRDYVAKHTTLEDIEFDPPFLVSPGLAADANPSLASTLAATARRHGARGRCVGVPFGTDAGVLAQAGVPAVVFGPGSIAQAHTRDEWVDVESLHQAVAILTDLCGQSPRTVLDADHPR